MSDRLTDHQIEVLAEHWPWEYEESERALRLAEQAGMPFDDTVRGLDALAERYGEKAHPTQIIKLAIEVALGGGLLDLDDAARRLAGIHRQWYGPS